MHLLRRPSFLVAAIAAAVALLGSPAGATHSWGGYHWARQSNPFTLKLGDNVSAAWDPILSTTSSDWSVSKVLDTTIVAGSASNLRRCQPTAGRVEVCNYTYGTNGWLGVASIWISGGHITQGAVKVNDSYFNQARYNTTAWRNLVMCQEVGHTLGLDHQDEDFGNPNLGTCMDYTNDPSSNQHPNSHDYAQLESIYAHTDSTTTVGQSAAGAAAADAAAGNSQAEWGRAIRTDGAGRPNLFVRDAGAGVSVFTFVTWA